MVIEAPSGPMTYEDLEQITDTRHRYEILQGELIVTAKPVPAHVIIGTRLGSLLYSHLREGGIGTSTVRPISW
jgi:Uma2 family endonuclease